MIFHGKMGAEKFDVLSQAHIALQNPTGATEAFPASALECMSVGLPVIASADYGMWDSMRYFPELHIRKPLDIVKRIEWLLTDEARYTSISQRALDVARCCAGETGNIVAQWSALLQALADGTPLSGVLTPPLPRPRHPVHFVRRILDNHWRILLTDTPLEAAWKFSKGLVAPRSN